MPFVAIGDVHGYTDRYLKIIGKNEYTVALGDINFSYGFLSEIDPAKHKIIGGNHDNYDIIDKCPHYLGDFGEVTINGVTFFFIRGALSVDKQRRIEGRSWWEREELTIQKGHKCLEAYQESKPIIVLSHDCPNSIIPHVITNKDKLIPSRTGQLLQALFEIHQPSQWIFGHHHNNRFVEKAGCVFRCVDELNIINIPM